MSDVLAFFSPSQSTFSRESTASDFTYVLRNFAEFVHQSLAVHLCQNTSLVVVPVQRESLIKCCVKTNSPTDVNLQILLSNGEWLHNFIYACSPVLGAPHDRVYLSTKV